MKHLPQSNRTTLITLASLLSLTCTWCTDKLEVVRKEIEESGGVAKSFVCDATAEESVAQSFKQIRDILGDPSV